MKDTFKVWRLALITVLIGFTVVGLTYVILEWPKPSYDPFYGYYGLDRNDAQHQLVVGLAVAIPLIDIALLIFISLLRKWEKDAKGYGLSIDSTRLNILCEGKPAAFEIKDVSRFEVLPKNCEPTLFKSKWADVGYIVANE